jgi:TDG/mug DNA glycosylase family protein
MTAHGHLPDQLRAGLDVVFVGTAAGRRSAAVGAYYAHPGNRFWRTLHAIELTPRLYAPSEFEELLSLGIGFTDMSKIGIGMDHDVRADQYDIARFERSIRTHQPRAVAFTSKKAASVWLRCGTKHIALGMQAVRHDGSPQTFVLPSPSGAAARFWDERPWRQLADWIRRTQI